jgi:site-specific DNA-methyltransferase (adenine-specific)
VIEIYNEDCMEAMKHMEDNQFDLAIVDPPYGIGNFIPQNNAPRQKK